MSNKLSDYGHAFQLKLIASLFVDKPFLQQVAEILIQNILNQNLINLLLKMFFSILENIKTHQR